MTRNKINKSINGWIGFLPPNSIAGWVYNKMDLAKRFDVVVEVNNQEIGNLKAETNRQTLLAKGIGDGNYGFKTTIPPGLLKRGKNKISFFLKENSNISFEFHLDHEATISDGIAQKNIKKEDKLPKMNGSNISKPLSKKNSDGPMTEITYGDLRNDTNPEPQFEKDGSRFDELSIDATKIAPKKSDFAREKQDNLVLLWAPIMVCGLTVQLEQVVKILNSKKIQYKISYHMRPNTEHPLTEHWIEPRDIDRPKLVIYFERFYEFDRGFDAAFKVFYMNLDWLSNSILSAARIHANVVLCPTTYLVDEFKNTFFNSQVIYLPWPPSITPRTFGNDNSADKIIRILYVGNDYDRKSRKHPFEVVEAIRNIKRDDVSFELKFRTALPRDIREELINNPIVKNVVDWPSDRNLIEEMYSRADINLIPNACEGNGLSILEAWATGVIPAVLNGHPMVDVTSEQNSYKIACKQIATQEHAPYYRTTSFDIVNFVNDLKLDDVIYKRSAVRDMGKILQERESTLKETINSFVKISGIRTKDMRLNIEKAHLSSDKYPNMLPRSGNRVKDLLFSDERQSFLIKKPNRIDVIMTTSRRPWCFRESLDQLLKAIRRSPFEHRLYVVIDAMDQGTLMQAISRSSEIDYLICTKDQNGLPFGWNTACEMTRNVINRTEIKPDFVCYIQDDCLIKDCDTYFDTMVSLSHAAMPGYLGLVSGYYTEVHPGFADFEWNGVRVIASDSIDGKNFMGRPELLASIGSLSWRFSDGMKRGNPGPTRGSHFDLWQWKESPNSLKHQNRISLIIPDACEHIAPKSKDSTWGNDTTEEAVSKRIADKRVYVTRRHDF